MMGTALSLLLLAIVAAIVPVSGQSGAIVIAITGRAHPDVMRGIQFGEHEMSQTARLLGRDVRVLERPETTPVDGWIVAVGDGPARDVPMIHLAGTPRGAGDCHFTIGLEPSGAGASEVLWHPSLARFGASELNERFVRRYDLPMTSDAWAGWVAVKALVESALRRRADERACDALARLRFDGHKGRPLFFDPSTRRLVQPVYVVKDGRVLGERQ